MINFKGCPKCQGDMVLEKDHYGWYHHCIQCGLHVDMPVLETLPAAQRINEQKLPATVVRPLICEREPVGMVQHDTG